ncbi:MAG: hypothetical protein FWE22_06875 [Firmicutes bacterium]|nr:hypothetical protein [Bacillota bacterium]
MSNKNTNKRDKKIELIRWLIPLPLSLIGAIIIIVILWNHERIDYIGGPFMVVVIGIGAGIIGFFVLMFIISIFTPKTQGDRDREKQSEIKRQNKEIHKQRSVNGTLDCPCGKTVYLIDYRCTGCHANTVSCSKSPRTIYCYQCKCYIYTITCDCGKVLTSKHIPW